MKSSLLALTGGLLVLAGAAGAPAEPANPGFTPSKFPHVVTRHIPGAPDADVSGRTTSAAHSKHDGIKLSNIRRAPDKRNGIIADIDPYTAPLHKAATHRNKRHKHRKR